MDRDYNFTLILIAICSFVLIISPALVGINDVINGEDSLRMVEEEIVDEEIVAIETNPDGLIYVSAETILLMANIDKNNRSSYWLDESTGNVWVRYFEYDFVFRVSDLENLPENNYLNDELAEEIKMKKREFYMNNLQSSDANNLWEYNANRGTLNQSMIENITVAEMMDIIDLDENGHPIFWLNDEQFWISSYGWNVPVNIIDLEYMPECKYHIYDDYKVRDKYYLEKPEESEWVVQSGWVIDGDV